MLKRIISGITTLSMCAAIIGIIPASADDAPPEATSAKRPLTIEFMGVGNTPAATGKKSGNLTAENATNKDKFWIGIGVEKVNDLPLFTDGVYSLEVAFEYDPAYLRPDAQDGVTEEVKESTWNTDIKNVNTGSGNDWDEKYLVESVIETDLDTETDRANKDKLTERANWKMCTVCLTLTESDIANIRFKGLDSPDKQYLVKLPFTLISVPNEYAKDQNPIVLSLVRGPETFDIGSGNLGETPNAKWNETENQEAANNLKTYFDFQGDIKLFGEEQAITDITPFRNIPQKDEDGNPIKDAEDNILTEEETYELSQDENLNGGEFNPEVDTYYLSISNQPNNLQLRILSSELPTVTVNGTEVNVTLVDGNYVTDAFELNELEQNPDGTYKSDEFRNTIVISTGDKSNKYTIHVRRLLQPRIELMPGNSPYGMIERMNKKYIGDEYGWSDEKVAQTKEEFKNSDVDHGNLVYGSNIPINAITNVKYSTVAWNSYDKNYDLDEFAIFVYEASKFVDPGIKIYNSMGKEIENVSYDREVTFKTMSVGEPDYSKSLTDDKRKIENQSNEYVFDLSGKIIRPDVYDMTYSYQYTDTNGDTQLFTCNRSVIVLSKRGDIQLTTDPSFNANDAKSFARSYPDWGGKEANSLFAFRVCDLQETTDPTVNSNDYKQMVTDITKYSDFPYNQYYYELPSDI